MGKCDSYCSERMSVSLSYVPIQREFSLLLLPMVEKKLRQIVPSLLDRPSLLAHTIYQSLIYDSALVEEGFSLVGTSIETNEGEKWPGTSEVILGNEKWFDVWLQAEKQCRLNPSALHCYRTC